jgi:hypothetical protein
MRSEHDLLAKRAGVAMSPTVASEYFGILDNLAIMVVVVVDLSTTRGRRLNLPCWLGRVIFLYTHGCPLGDLISECLLYFFRLFLQNPPWPCMPHRIHPEATLLGQLIHVWLRVGKPDGMLGGW